MNVSFIKQIKDLEREVLLKSVELDDDGDDFQFELDDFSTNEEIFVKCEICIQTCPVSAIKLIDNSISYDHEDEREVIEYNLSNVSCAHRVIRMNDISIDYTVEDNNWDDCANLCPTNAFTMEFKEFFENLDMDLGIELIEDELYPYINEKMCIGCGACREISLNDFAVNLDRYIGPIIHSRLIEINHESCVNCYLCEENCPTGAIELVDGEVVLDNDKCIRCTECTNHCPVGALKRVEIE